MCCERCHNSVKQDKDKDKEGVRERERARSGNRVIRFSVLQVNDFEDLDGDPDDSDKIGPNRQITASIG